ncbi:uncharacterized protein LOC126766204 [Bactrocera neohumeralis]|uniref:uncharacterized protein LOC126766204 n=1 Tax=Bactrocera neohumeralis TaxID=98809 RepID=UPI002165D762|nr:uncharacterized protein LOC126766204 [Bactrocera neohumeralis]
MRGTAKLFLETVSVSNFDSLCEALKEEFDIKFNSADIHQKLMQRRKKYDKNFYEYILQMRTLAALGSIEEGVVIRYIVDGIKQMSYKQNSSGAVQKETTRSLRKMLKTMRAKIAQKVDIVSIGGHLRTYAQNGSQKQNALNATAVVTSQKL